MATKAGKRAQRRKKLKLVKRAIERLPAKDKKNYIVKGFVETGLRINRPNALPMKQIPILESLSDLIKKKIVEAKDANITIEGEYAISLEDIGKGMKSTMNRFGFEPHKIIQLINGKRDLVNKYVKGELEKDIKANKAKNIKIDDCDFSECDSTNISHGSCYFNVKLTGTEKELKKIADEDKLISYQWEEDVNESTPANPISRDKALKILSQNGCEPDKLVKRDDQEFVAYADLTRVRISREWENQVKDALDKSGSSYTIRERGKYIKTDMPDKGKSWYVRFELIPTVSEAAIKPEDQEFEIQIKPDPRDQENAVKVANKMGIDNAWGESFFVTGVSALRKFVNTILDFDVEIMSILDINNQPVEVEAYLNRGNSTGRHSNEKTYANRMRRDHHIDEGKEMKEQGGIPDSIWEQTAIKNYEGGYGWIYSDNRNEEEDKTLIGLLQAKKLTDEQIACFMVSSYGRKYGDALINSGDAEKQLPRMIQLFMRDFEKHGAEIFESKKYTSEEVEKGLLAGDFEVQVGKTNKYIDHQKGTFFLLNSENDVIQEYKAKTIQDALNAMIKDKWLKAGITTKDLKPFDIDEAKEPGKMHSIPYPYTTNDKATKQKALLNSQEFEKLANNYRMLTELTTWGVWQDSGRGRTTMMTIDDKMAKQIYAAFKTYIKNEGTTHVLDELAHMLGIESEEDPATAAKTNEAKVNLANIKNVSVRKK